MPRQPHSTDKRFRRNDPSDQSPRQKTETTAPRAVQPVPESATQRLRLNKAIALAGVCSRRKADELIQQGLVQINGDTVLTPGLSIDPAHDVVAVRGQILDLPHASAGHAYILLHKPVKIVTTVSDPQGRPTVLDMLPPELRQRRLFPVGRLDYFSEGLLLLTTDGDLAYRMTHARFHLPKVYHVRVRGLVADSILESMRQGMTLAEGERLAPVPARVLEIDRLAPATILELTLIQGVNRQIRRMCRDLQLTVLQLTRVSQGPLLLDDLKPGAWRRLSPEEYDALRQALALP